MYNFPTPGPDDPFWDGTDAAHPAWWRGQDDGAKGVARLILRVMANCDPENVVDCVTKVLKRFTKEDDNG